MLPDVLIFTIWKESARLKVLYFPFQAATADEEDVEVDAEHPEVVLEAAAVAVASVFVEAGSAAEAVLAAVGVAASGVAAAVEVVAVASEEGAVSEVAKFGRGGSFWIEKMLPVLPGSPFCFYFCAPLIFKKRFLYTKKNSCFEIHQMNQSLFLLVL